MARSSTCPRRSPRSCTSPRDSRSAWSPPFPGSAPSPPLTCCRASATVPQPSPARRPHAAHCRLRQLCVSQRAARSAARDAVRRRLRIRRRATAFLDVSHRLLGRSRQGRRHRAHRRRQSRRIYRAQPQSLGRPAFHSSSAGLYVLAGLTVMNAGSWHGKRGPAPGVQPTGGSDGKSKAFSWRPRSPCPFQTTMWVPHPNRVFCG